MMRRTNTPARRARLLAEERVRNGIKWLQECAPYGWQRNLFQVIRGSHGELRVMTRFTVAHNEEGVLAAAFDGATHLPANEVDLIKHFNLQGKMEKLGFNADGAVSADVLNSAWVRAVTSYAEPPFSVRRR